MLPTRPQLQTRHSRISLGFVIVFAIRWSASRHIKAVTLQHSFTFSQELIWASGIPQDYCDMFRTEAAAKAEPLASQIFTSLCISFFFIRKCKMFE